MNWLCSLCDFKLLKSGDLRKSSLNRHSISQKSEVKQSEMEPLKLLNDSITTHQFAREDLRKEPETPSVRLDKEKAKVTEKDFRIMQVTGFILKNPKLN